SLQADAFFAYFFWRFTCDFPESLSSPKLQKVLARGTAGALILAFVLFTWQLLLILLGFQKALAAGASPLDFAPEKPSWEYYGPLTLATVYALVVLFRRARAAEPVERRRVGLLVGSLVLGIGPLF